MSKKLASYYIGKERGNIAVVGTDGDLLICQCKLCGKTIPVPVKEFLRAMIVCGCKLGQKHYFPKTCIRCGKKFEGGPKAKYCPDCAIESQKETSARSKERQRNGTAKKIGEEMQCVRCGKMTIRRSGNQRYCEECAKENIAEIDRKRAIARYHECKEKINPERYKFRKIKNTPLDGVILTSWNNHHSLRSVCKELNISWNKVTKSLSSQNVIISDFHRDIINLYNGGKSAQEIADALGSNIRTVQSYLPRTRPEYGVCQSDNALRIEKCRKNKIDPSTK